MKLVWDQLAWDDHPWWQTEDGKVLKRIKDLFKDMRRNGNEGIGKPEPLKHSVPRILVTPHHRRAQAHL